MRTNDYRSTVLEKTEEHRIRGTGGIGHSR